MLDTLNLVHGAVGSRVLLDILTTFHIYDGRVQAGNGRIAIDASCPELKGLNVTLDAERFVKACESCNGQPSIGVEDGQLTVKHKRFRAKMTLVDSSQYPRARIDDDLAIETFPLKPKASKLLLHAFGLLRPFISTDASRPWSMGVLLKKGWAYATNNVLLVRVPIEADTEETVIPVFAIDELLRIGAEPVEMRRTSTALFFVFGTWWLRSQLLTAPWPDVAAMFAKRPKKLPAVPPTLGDAVGKVVAFVPDQKYPVIKLGAEGVKTMEGDYFAQVDGIKLPEAAFRSEPLKLLLEHAEKCDFSTYPSPCPWEGKGMEGFIVGVRA